MCTGFGVSKEQYRGTNKRLAETGQRNVILGNIYRDISSVIFKSTEKKQCRNNNNSTNIKRKRITISNGIH